MRNLELGLGFGTPYSNGPSYPYAAIADKAVAVTSLERLIPSSGPLAVIYRYTDGQSMTVYSHDDIDAFLAGSYGRLTTWYDQKTGEALTASGGSQDKLLVKVNGRWGVNVQSNGATKFMWNVSGPSALATALSNVPSIQLSFIDLNGGEDIWTGSAAVFLVSTNDSTSNNRATIFREATSSIATLSYRGRKVDATSTTNRTGLTNVVSDQILVGSWDYYNSTMRVWREGATVDLDQSAQFGTTGANCSATTPMEVSFRASCSGATIMERCIFTGLTDAEIQIVRTRQASYKTVPSIIPTLFNAGWTMPNSPSFLYDGTNYVASVVGAQGYQRVYQFNASGVITSAVTTSVAYAGRDDHDSPAILKTPGGALLTAWAGHNISATWNYMRSTSLSPSDFVSTNSKTVTGMGGSSSYAQLFANGTDVYGSCRQQYTSPSTYNSWWIFKSTDDGATFDSGKEWIKDSDQVYVQYYPMGSNIVRFVSTRNADSTTNEMKVGYIDLSTETVYSGGAAVGTYTSGAVNWSALTSIITYAGAGKKIAMDSIGFNGNTVSFELYDGTSYATKAFHFAGGDFGVAANWTMKDVTPSSPLFGFYQLPSRSTVSRDTTLSQPRIYATGNDGATFWVKQYDYNGTSWSETGTLDTIAMTGANAFYKPLPCTGGIGSYDVAVPKGPYREYTDYQTDVPVFKPLSVYNKSSYAAVDNADSISKLPAFGADFRNGWYAQTDVSDVAGASVSALAATKTATFSDLFTFTRAGSATYFNASGVLQTAGTDVPRFDYSTGKRRLCLESASTNSIRNSTMAGASSPSTGPTNWQFSGLSGVTATISGTGTQYGMAYIDLTVSGTAASTGDVVIDPEQISIISASSGQTWIHSAYFSLISGSLSGVSPPYIGVSGRTSGGSTTEIQTTSFSGLTSTLTRYSSRITLANASTAYVKPQIRFTIPSGNTVNFTVRIYAPQLELGQYAPTSFIPTSGAAASRAADKCQFSAKALALFNRSDVSAVVKGTGVNGYSARIIGAQGNNLVSGTTGSASQIKLGNDANALYVGTYTPPWPDFGEAFSLSSAYKAVVASGYTLVSNAYPLGLSITELYLGRDGNGTTNYGNIMLDEVIVYPFRMTDASLTGKAAVYG